MENQNQKNQIEESKKSDSKKSNLEKLLSDANQMNISSHLGGKSREKIYKFQLSGDIPSIDQKKMRNKIRRDGDRFCMNIISNFKSSGGKMNDDLKKSISDFMIFYKEKFILNDLSLSSFSASNRNDADKKMISLALNICKESLAK